MPLLWCKRRNNGCLQRGWNQLCIEFSTLKSFIYTDRVSQKCIHTSNDRKISFTYLIFNIYTSAKKCDDRESRDMPHLPHRLIGVCHVWAEENNEKSRFPRFMQIVTKCIHTSNERKLKFCNFILNTLIWKVRKGSLSHVIWVINVTDLDKYVGYFTG